MNEYQINQVLVTGLSENYIRSGVRIIDIVERGLVVQRINACYLDRDPIESWTLRWDQVENSNWFPLPVGYQMPLL